MGKITITPAYLRGLFPAVAQIEDVQTLKKLAAVWDEMFQQSAWDTPEQACFSPDLPQYRLVDHVNVTIEGTLAVADCIEKYQHIPFDREAIIVLGVLHDASKLVEYAPAPDGGCAATEIGRTIQHGVMAACSALRHGFSLGVMNQILTHTPRSRMKPSDKEALLFAHVDLSDADTLHLLNQLPLFL